MGKGLLPIVAFIGSVGLFFVIQMVFPFPYGFVMGIVIPALIIWYVLKKIRDDPFSLLSYRRADPMTKKEMEQNKEAFRLLKKRFLEGEITQDEFEKIKKGFEDMGLD
jgi:uncharacterized membrane protein